MAATPATHFKILETLDPNVIIAHHNGNLILQDFDYAIATQNLLSFKRMPAFDGLALGLSLSYNTKVTGDELLEVSNNALMNIKWNGVEARPLSADYTEVILNADIVNILSKLPLNDKVEFIKIDSILGYPNLIKNNTNVSVGVQLGLVEAYYTSFIAAIEGNGLSYFEMYYKVGAGTTLEAEIYKLAFSIDPLAKSKLLLLVGGTNPERFEYSEDFDNGAGGFNTFDVVEEVTLISLEEGVINGIANVEINITADFLNNDEFGSVIISINGEETEYITTPIISINESVELDQLGNAEIIVRAINVHDVVKAGGFDLAIDLIDVNGNNTYVSGTFNHNHVSVL
jgi:hypothetical protein